MYALIEKHSMIRKILKGFFILYIGLLCMFILQGHMNGVSILGALILITFRYMRLKGSWLLDHYPIGYYLLPILEFILIIQFFFGTQTKIENLVLILFTFDVILFYRAWFGLGFSIVGFLIYTVLWKEYQNDILGLVISVLNYSLLIATVWGAKMLFKQWIKIGELNQTMRQQAIAMEEVAKLKERQLIAEEMHHSVGHQLTTAIVSLEAAHLLFDKNPQEAHEKLNVARTQLKEGLSDIREVVRAIRSFDDIRRDQSLKSALEQLIDGVKLQTGIKIAFHYDVDQPLLSIQEHVLINAVKEGITNALKHGKAKLINVRIVSLSQQLELIIDDVGLTCDVIIPGFGLETIRSSIEAIGGTMDTQAKEDGFIVAIHLPFVEA